MRLHALVAVVTLFACGESQVPPSSPSPPTTVASVDDPRCWYGRCEGPFHSAEPVRYGRYQVGDEIAAIPVDAITRQGDCASEADNYHCSFTLDDGIEYLAYDRWIARKRIALPTTHALPFGLRGDETVLELAQLVRHLLGVEARIVPLSRGAILITHGGTLGTLENPQWLEFTVEADGRFSEICWQGPPTV